MSIRDVILTSISTTLAFWICILGALFFLTSCTISVNTIHTQGTATDLLDENQAASPDIQADLSIPASVI